MYWKKFANGENILVSVSSLREIDNGKQLYGKRTYELTLSDGTKEVTSFESADWNKFESSFLKGVFVVNT